ncbi:flagellar motor protein MotD [Pseudomonas sp. FME51]|uniref:flagellar motor protein MotD n=1 Tax=Pseudomonas sp. FME51 TaxID=2742609 RepID=UPI001867DA60|nr:flagellar motor protein MotD [Pseudomonas sp. FME51]
MRRRREEEEVNNERWMVSYADFITLLFAFFVVMYSISSVNEGKYKVLSDSLIGAFSQTAKTIDPIQIGEHMPRSVVPLPETAPQASMVTAQTGSSGAANDPLEDIAEAMQAAFGELISVGDLQVHANELWIEIELNSGLLFPSGDALPLDAAFALIERIADILTPYDNPIHVEGFTDNVPISSMTYPTNWELSAARAASVVRMLSAGGIDAARLAAVGYGEHRPVGDNTTAAGRRANRRVVLLVSRYTDTRHQNLQAGSAELQGMRQARAETGDGSRISGTN